MSHITAATEGAGRYDRLHGDEDLPPEYTAEEQALIEAETKRIAAQRLADRDWWTDQLDGYNATTAALPATMARAMESLDLACNGDPIATQAILAALSNLQKQARTEALQGAEEAAEQSLAEGELA